ncbi:Peptidase-S9 domain-containing protein [Mycena venus]|uniref:Peptidase-S9 domain-containing protein n=1 Tax=Mycena venus TaxID=2733690 RepID=A0A8H6YVG9_9AGAR|nr:Peptidase-S9 domain-containing protein [Mycena venus]
MTDRLSTRLAIPHPLAPDCPIAGILEQLDTAKSKSTQGQKIALILHGAMGHKDYLFQRHLAQRLPLDSFRFDFRGNHETPGTWSQGGFVDDLQDLSAVAKYLENVYGYVISAVIGHSRGSLVGMRWISTAPEARDVTAFINVSSRYRMAKILEGPAAKIRQEAFDAHGFYDWTTTVARKPVTVRMYPAGQDLFVNWDTSFVWDKFPTNVHVLTLHGLSDQTVPPYDAHIYARALGARSPGTHTLHMVEDADHNFTGRQDQVVDYILEWWDLYLRGELKSSGLWMTGVRGKL